MTFLRPDILATRAVNQYRGSDIIPYLSLRYCFASTATRKRQWIEDIASSLAAHQTGFPYYRVAHFKEMKTRQPHTRQIHVPTAVQAISESALLHQCALSPQTFTNPDRVYSYALASGDWRQGVYQHYSQGLRRRHQDIAKACRKHSGGVVWYRDIRQFYPSIQLCSARSVWDRYAIEGGLESRYVELGHRLIESQDVPMEMGRRPEASHDRALLVGPMISHLIGNLVLRDLDARCAKVTEVDYFRYVDDIALVGALRDVVKCIKVIETHLGNLGLQLHSPSSPKSIEVPCEKWLKAENDFAERDEWPSWRTLIGELKMFLAREPERRDRLSAALTEKGIRLPVPNYTRAVMEGSYLARLREWAPSRWFRQLYARASVEGICDQALKLSSKFVDEIRETAAVYHRLSPFDKKRCLPGLRYRLGRLPYIATDGSLGSVVDVVREIDEVACHRAIVEAATSRSVDEVLSFGVNAAQAVAQLMRAANSTALCRRASLNSEESQALCIFALNGVQIDRIPMLDASAADLWAYATDDCNEPSLARSSEVIREAACLHGVGGRRHSATIAAAFDIDDVLAFDATTVGSGSGMS